MTGLRDRALIALEAYTFARIGAAVGMKVEDYFVQGRRGWVRLYEKGGKHHEVPANHNLDEYLEAYIRGRGTPTRSGSYSARRWGKRMF
jgi:integrase/recombinase XerD